MGECKNKEQQHNKSHDNIVPYIHVYKYIAHLYMNDMSISLCVRGKCYAKTKSRRAADNALRKFI